MNDPRKPATPTGPPLDPQQTHDTTADGTDPGPKSAPGGGASLRFLGPPLAPGELGRLGGYRVIEVLGEGGMGVVFRAEDPHLRRPVAVKVMRPEVAANPVAADRFLREARTAARVKHDHVVTIYQVGQDRGVPFIAMEFLRGEPLDALAKRLGPLPPFEVMRIGHQVALGLAAAHETGLVHRDVKPANVWLEAPTGRVKLLDFGLAREVKEDTNLTKTGAVLGTPAYMSPEQAHGQPVDARSDLFSLGVMLYRLATGVPPFPGDSALAILSSLAFHDPVPPGQLVPEIPPALDGLIRALLTKDPAGRPQTAREVAEALAPAVNTVTVVQVVHDPTASPSPARGIDPTFAFDSGPTQTDPPPAPSKPRHRPRPGFPVLLVSLSGLVLLVAIGVGVRKAFRTAPAEATRPATAPAVPPAASGVPPPPKPAPWPPADFAKHTPDEQFGAVTRRLKLLHPKWSGEGTLYQDERFVRLDGRHLNDLSPLAALTWLEHLEFTSTAADRQLGVRDLSGLRRLRLKSLVVAISRVSDLTPIAGMPLAFLHVEVTDVADLSPLRDVTSLRHLNIDQTRVTDLSPLAGARLVTFDVGSLQPKTWEPVGNMPLQWLRGFGRGNRAAVRAAFPGSHRRIEFISDVPARQFWGDETTFLRTVFPPPDPAWLAATRQLKPDERHKEVVAELKRRNPEWIGEAFGTRTDGDAVTELGLYTPGLRDLTPLRALDGLKVLRVNRTQTGFGPLLSDLEPVRGLKLEEFRSHGNVFLDLAALREMPLRAVHLEPYKDWYDADLKAAISTLSTVNGTPVADFWANRK